MMSRDEFRKLFAFFSAHIVITGDRDDADVRRLLELAECFEAHDAVLASKVMVIVEAMRDLNDYVMLKNEVRQETADQAHTLPSKKSR